MCGLLVITPISSHIELPIMVFWQLLYQGIPQQPCSTSQTPPLGIRKLSSNCINAALPSANPSLSSPHFNLVSSLNKPPSYWDGREQTSSFDGTARGNRTLKVLLLQLTETSLIIECVVYLQHSYNFVPNPPNSVAQLSIWARCVLPILPQHGPESGLSKYLIQEPRSKF